MVDSDVYLKKQWFIKSKGGKVEEHYKFDIKKVLNFFIPVLNSDLSCWAPEPMEMSLKQPRTAPTS